MLKNDLSQDQQKKKKSVLLIGGDWKWSFISKIVTPLNSINIMILKIQRFGHTVLYLYIAS